MQDSAVKQKNVEFEDEDSGDPSAGDLPPAVGAPSDPPATELAARSGAKNDYRNYDDNDDAGYENEREDEEGDDTLQQVENNQLQ